MRFRQVFIAGTVVLFTGYLRGDSPRIELRQGEGPLRIAVLADLHGSGAARIAPELRRIHNTNPLNAVLLLGDNFDGCGAEGALDPDWRWITDHLATLGVPVFPILGNHDYGNPKRKPLSISICGTPDPESQVRARIPNWIFPARNYVISTPLVDIIMADTTPLVLDVKESLLGSASASAIRQFVSGSLQASTKKWRIVAGHHNLAEHSGKRRWKSATTRRMMRSFGEMLRAREADLYLSGHQHQLELLDRTPHSPYALITGASSKPKTTDALRHRHPSSLFMARSGSRALAFAILQIDKESIRVTLHDGATPEIQTVYSFHNGRQERVSATDNGVSVLVAAQK